LISETIASRHQPSVTGNNKICRYKTTDIIRNTCNIKTALDIILGDGTKFNYAHLINIRRAFKYIDISIAMLVLIG